LEPGVGDDRGAVGELAEEGAQAGHDLVVWGEELKGFEENVILPGSDE
jgi:hypothetical protein